MSPSISGFSKFSKEEKLNWIADRFFSDTQGAKAVLKQYWNTDAKLQRLHDEFIENTVSNYYLPFAVAPNFLINDKWHTIPMAIEESSVVAAASKAAKFWSTRGGFKAEVIATKKVGQVHFFFKGDSDKLYRFFNDIKFKLLIDVQSITRNMENRGGGIIDIELRDRSNALKNYYQLHARFETQDAMGANFINSCLEQFAKTFKQEANRYDAFNDDEKDINIIMSILSNYVPECLVRAEVNCAVQELTIDGIPAEDFTEKFVQAISIAEVEPYRAVTHNKGIMNGIDAVVLATGNDFRAVEAGAHAYAARSGIYRSLTHASVEDGQFRFSIEIPLALGTVGGLTSLHPLVKLALELLGNPTARELMEIVAVAGLAQNFAAIKSLITTGIQKGHMKMHLMNILNQYQANETEKMALIEHFKHHAVSHIAVSEALNKLRVKS